MTIYSASAKFYSVSETIPSSINKDASVVIKEGSSTPSNDDFYVPSTLMIGKGTTVTWKNEDSTLHTVTSGTAESDISGTEFDSSYLAGGKSFQHTFSGAGTFEYYCTLHPFMKAKVIVGTDKVKSDTPPALNTPIIDGENIQANETQVSQTNGSEINTSRPLIFEDELGTQNLPKNNLETYNDNDIGYSINYPSDWTINDDNSQPYTLTSFDSPDKKVHVDVRMFSSKGYESIKEYGDKNFKESEDYTLLQYYRNSTTLLSEKPAIKAIYLTNSNPGLLGYALGSSSTTSKAMMIATLVPEKKSIFAIAYFASPNNFNEYLPDVQTIVKSFQMSTKGPIIQEED